MTYVIVLLVVALVFVLFFATGVVLGVWRHVRTPRLRRKNAFAHQQGFIKTASV